MRSFQQATLEAHNELRTNPQSIIPILKEMLKHFKGTSYRPPEAKATLMTSEGSPAVKEAIEFLEKQKPVGKLELSDFISMAARDHARDQSKSGKTGHDGSDKSTVSNRVERFCKWTRTVGENITYCTDNAKGAVIGLLVDDGVKDRGHRTNLFNPEFTHMGAWREPFPKYGYTTVFDYTGGVEEKGDELPPAAQAFKQEVDKEIPPPIDLSKPSAKPSSKPKPNKPSTKPKPGKPSNKPKPRAIPSVKPRNLRGNRGNRQDGKEQESKEKEERLEITEEEAKKIGKPSKIEVTYSYDSKSITIRTKTRYKIKDSKNPVFISVEQINY